MSDARTSTDSQQSPDPNEKLVKVLVQSKSRKLSW